MSEILQDTSRQTKIFNSPYDSAASLLQAIHSGKISSREALQLYLERVEKYNPGLNAIVALDVETAQQRAREADEALARGELWGPLHGLPMTVKDVFEVRGMPATAGALELKDHVPKRNADAVQNLLDAGAIIFGKTNVPRFASDHQSYNEVYGTSNNPWDLERTPGGSSGGAAASLAAGMTPLEMGSDIGGSIRIPAHYCGVYGHKSSYGSVSYQGHIPNLPGSLLTSDLVSMGPLARHPEDLALALPIMAGPGGFDQPAWQLNLPRARHTSLKDFRVACWIEDPAAAVDEPLQQSLKEAIDALRSAGARVDETARPGISFEEMRDLFFLLLAGALSDSFTDKEFRIFKLMAPFVSFGKSLFSLYARGLVMKHRDWLILHEKRQQVRKKWNEFFKQYDVLLTPVSPTAAFPHMQKGLPATRSLTINGEKRSFLENLNWISLAGLAYLPATTAPVGITGSGLPLGIQIIGPHLEDLTTIEFAKLAQEAWGGFKQPPGYE
ncbi:MAG: amidase [bacterium]|nr:amidase [bacterium]